ncbi:MAG: hypothetical protein PHN90_13790 [Methanothrix sp.]|jgi:hypothetical protein|nr:hypothetical protein [Methanothrix sp.]OPX81881.1 MAG: hypothetical protein A4E50_00721 [Methanosaeta sp. PtaB.Bin087]OPY57116.1 MAG: hypothetical protein A4E51_00139 [Methanosaeta sp. PtaU1.Bin055]NLX38763.1 hypothetical protein [Methanothrix sp.]HNR56871.1 hypothetical protein [Methanothrix sp.]
MRLEIKGGFGRSTLDHGSSFVLSNDHLYKPKRKEEAEYGRFRTKITYAGGLGGA